MCEDHTNIEKYMEGTSKKRRRKKKTLKKRESTCPDGTEQTVPLQNNDRTFIHICLKCFCSTAKVHKCYALLLKMCLLSSITAMPINSVFTRHGLSVIALCSSISQFRSPSLSNLH